MFDETWKWAGKFRLTAKNIGVEPHQIQEQLANLCANATYWLDNETYPIDQRAIRFHHQLVNILKI
jgi:fido (protein-threonine AMPylation protein)